MKEIPLTRGKVALVDDNDYEWLNQLKWYYAPRGCAEHTKRENLRNINIKMHRLIMNAPIDKIVEHANGNPLDNRRCNLRICTQKDNCHNTRMRSDNTSGYKGVSWSKDKREWVSFIKLDNYHKFLGYYDDKIDAARAYDTAARKYYGEFARINNI